MARDIFRLAYDIHMEAGSSDTAEVMLYGEIVEDGPGWWKWSKEDKSAAEFDKEIKDAMEKGATKLLLRINSPGGICTQAVAMRSILVNAGFEEINIRIEGMCASAATDLATLPGAHVVISEGSEYMIHNPWCYALGNANELEHTVERLRNIEQMSRGFYAKRTGQTDEQIKTWMDAETWFTAEQAVTYGFADEVLRAEVSKGTPPAACVSGREMEVMRGIYRAVPAQVLAQEKESGEPATAKPEGQEKEETMEINELTVEQISKGNPELLAQIRQDAVNAERGRLEDIDALTVPGYEEMAEKAKADGTSALDFQKQLVTAMKQKGSSFIQSRQKETAPAQSVKGGEPSGRTEEQEIQDNAKDIAAYAAAYAGSHDAGMF